MLDFGCWLKTKNLGAQRLPSTNIQNPTSNIQVFNYAD